MHWGPEPVKSSRVRVHVHLHHYSGTFEYYGIATWPVATAKQPTTDYEERNLVSRVLSTERTCYGVRSNFGSSHVWFKGYRFMICMRPFDAA